MLLRCSLAHVEKSGNHDHEKRTNKGLRKLDKKQKRIERKLNKMR